jgi:NAD(P)H-dependent flavin oxidoreductase YrpB (nitropropane dioxygenase family)
VFALSRESGLTPELRRQILHQLSDGELRVTTDGSASPTGFPFKVHQLEGTLSDPAVRNARDRKCDLGYLRQPVVRNGKVVYTCPAEPEPTYKSKGGREPQTSGRVCLCNALFAAAGLSQRRLGGYVEPPIFTGGADLETVHRLSPDGDEYSATDAMSFIRTGALTA